MAKGMKMPPMAPAVVKTKQTKSPPMGAKTSPRIKNFTLPKGGGGKKR
jgi:hypothetical protein